MSMNAKEYYEYVQRVNDFFEREGINNLSSDSNHYEEGCIEPHFTWKHCDVCGGLPGDRYFMAGYNRKTKEIQDGYEVCPDCYYFSAYGQIDDMTMMDIPQETQRRISELENDIEYLKDEIERYKHEIPPRWVTTGDLKTDLENAEKELSEMKAALNRYENDV